jgi:hypothetical protein
MISYIIITYVGRRIMYLPIIIIYATHPPEPAIKQTTHKITPTPTHPKRSGKKNVGREVLAVTSVAVLVMLWYTDIAGLQHGPVLTSQYTPPLKLPLSPFTLSSSFLGLLLGECSRTNFSVGPSLFYDGWDGTGRDGTGLDGCIVSGSSTVVIVVVSQTIVLQLCSHFLLT